MVLKSHDLHPLQQNIPKDCWMTKSERNLPGVRERERERETLIKYMELEWSSQCCEPNKSGMLQWGGAKLDVMTVAHNWYWPFRTYMSLKQKRSVGTDLSEECSHWDVQMSQTNSWIQHKQELKCSILGHATYGFHGTKWPSRYTHKFRVSK